MLGPASRFSLLMPCLCLAWSLAGVLAAREWLVQPEAVALRCAVMVMAPECLLRQGLITGFLHGYWSLAAALTLLLSWVGPRMARTAVLLALMLSVTTLVLYRADEGAPLLLLCWLRVLWLFSPDGPNRETWAHA